MTNIVINNTDRARILVHALPYIQKYSGKIVVVKYGGNAMTSESLKDSVMRDIVLMSLIGILARARCALSPWTWGRQICGQPVCPPPSAASG